MQRYLIMTLLMLFLPGMNLTAGALEDTAAAKPQILRHDSVTKGYEPLPVGEQNIAAAYLPQTLGIPRGAVLLLHDINEHIDSAAIGILRRQLPSHGWNTMAIKIIRFHEDNEPDPPAIEAAPADEAPQTEAGEPAEPLAADVENTAAEADEPVATQTDFTVVSTAQRIDAALIKLQQEGHENIVLIGQGAGGELALKTLAQTAVPVAAVVMINTGELANQGIMTETNIPLLDIIASRQRDSVKAAVRKRQTQMKTAKKTNYHLRQINGANHYFSSVPQQLTNQIHGWLFSQFFEEKDAP